MELLSVDPRRDPNAFLATAAATRAAAVSEPRPQPQSEMDFADIYAVHHGPIFGYLLRLTGCAELAADLTHDTFLSAWEALPGLREDASITSWLYRIAGNRFRDTLRRKKIIRWLSTTERTDFEHLMVENCDQESLGEREVVIAALMRLRPDYRLCLTLRLAEGFTTDETAAIVGTSPEAVRMRLCRARQMFREAYAAVEHGLAAPPTPIPALAFSV
jgi:RNA polymerase sigma-70 factor (ECF subfamily)